MIADPAVLEKISLFRGIALPDIERIIAGCRKVTYQKGEAVAAEGDTCHAFGIILSGAITIIKENAAGEGQILAKLGAGKIFGEILIYSTKKKWPASVWAGENCQICFMDVARISEFALHDTALYQKMTTNLWQEISDKSLGLNKKLEYFSLKKMRGKIAKCILEHAENQDSEYFELPFNRQEMADFLSVSRSSMLREMSSMKQDGLIDFHKKYFKILDKKKLQSEVK